MLDFLTDWSVQQAFLQGLATTLRLSFISAGLALCIGFLMAFARVSRLRPLGWLSEGYVALFRNTPLLIQLYLCYRGLQSLGLILSPELCGVMALSLYSGAYLTEVFRSGLLAIPNEQLDAGLSLGLSRFSVYRMILIPQALRVILPAVGNQLISLTKNSSLVAFITVNDLFYVVYKGAVDAFQPLEYFLEGAMLYLAVSLAISGLVRLLEHCLFHPATEEQPVSGEVLTHG
jgi:His/Glu/Gln/Arg/opine family amino acid ABC transporter permease subunit